MLVLGRKGSGRRGKEVVVGRWRGWGVEGGEGRGAQL